MAKAAPAPRLAIVGSDSFIGRELRELLSEKRLATALDLVSSSDSEESLRSEEDSDPVVLAPLRAESLGNARLIFLAGSKETSSRVSSMKLAAPMVDLTAGLATMPGAVIRAPMAEPERYLSPETRATVIAHPAAILIAMLLRRVHSVAPIRHAVLTVFEPASQRGREAIDELQQQTVGLLNLKSFPKEVFDEQLSFNMLSRLGADAPQSLASAQLRIEADLKSLLAMAPAVPLPSVRLIHAPVFHGYTASAWIDFESVPDLARLSAWLKSPQIDVRTPDEEGPTNVGMAGQSGIGIDTIQFDNAHPKAAWVWIAADNMRLLIENAILAAASILEQSARPVQ